MDPAPDASSLPGREDMSSGLADAAGAENPAPLVEARRWEALAAAEDPFEDRPSPDPVCGAGGVKVEEEGGADPVLEVDTGACRYVTLAQPSLVALGAGDEVEAVLWHLDLFAEEPAEAHVAIQIGEHTMWEERIPVPSKANFFSPRWTAPEEVPRGTPVLFHLHNHGVNNWKLLRIRRVDPAP